MSAALSASLLPSDHVCLLRLSHPVLIQDLLLLKVDLFFVDIGPDPLVLLPVTALTAATLPVHVPVLRTGPRLGVLLPGVIERPAVDIPVFVREFTHLFHLIRAPLAHEFGAGPVRQLPNPIFLPILPRAHISVPISINKKPLGKPVLLRIMAVFPTRFAVNFQIL